MKPESIKKPFKTPQLIVYGDIREITQATGSTGMGDGNPSMSGPQKTSLP